MTSPMTNPAGAAFLNEIFCPAMICTSIIEYYAIAERRLSKRISVPKTENPYWEYRERAALLFREHCATYNACAGVRWRN